MPVCLTLPVSLQRQTSRDEAVEETKNETEGIAHNREIPVPSIRFCYILLAPLHSRFMVRVRSVRSIHRCWSPESPRLPRVSRGGCSGNITLLHLEVRCVYLDVEELRGRSRAVTEGSPPPFPHDLSSFSFFFLCHNYTN